MTDRESVEHALAAPERFRAWLEQNSTRHFTARQVDYCPLSCYVEDVCGADFYGVCVGSTSVTWSVRYGRPLRSAPLPGWAVAFVHAVDEGRARGDQVPAGGALIALDQPIALLAVPA